MGQESKAITMNSAVRYAVTENVLVKKCYLISVIFSLSTIRNSKAAVVFYAY